MQCKLRVYSQQVVITRLIIVLIYARCIVERRIYICEYIYYMYITGLILIRLILCA